MDQLDDSIKAWGKALEAIPRDNLDERQKNIQQSEYEQGKKKAEARKNSPHVVPVHTQQDSRPWHLAKALEADLIAANEDKNSELHDSSVSFLF